MKTKQIIRNTLLLWLISITSWAQESAVTAGGEATGSGGTVSYSIGQVFYTETSTSGSSVSEGLQQSYEIFVLGVAHPDFTMDLNAYPNPTRDKLTLHIEEYNNEKLNYQLYNMSGRLLKNGVIKEFNTSIDLSNQNSGIYLLKVASDQQEIQTFKIIKH